MDLNTRVLEDQDIYIYIFLLHQLKFRYQSKTGILSDNLRQLKASISMTSNLRKYTVYTFTYNYVV